MSPTLDFRTSAEGQVPESARATAVLMGKPATADHLAESIARALEDGNARPVNWMTASVRATPGGGLEPKGDETQKYNYRGESMFGLDEGPVSKRGMS